jgi:hypothetical protein
MYMDIILGVERQNFGLSYLNRKGTYTVQKKKRKFYNVLVLDENLDRYTTQTIHNVSHELDLIF